MAMDFDSTNENRNLMYNLSCYSSAMSNLQIEKKNGKLFSIRPTIHLYIYGRFGLQKSQTFDDIEKAFDLPGHPVITIDDLTAASVMGSIDQKTREIIYPAAFYCKNGSLLVDEFNIDPNQASAIVKAFLKLLEQEKVERRIALKEKEPFVTDDIKCKDGWLKFRHLRCNVIFATMKNIKMNRETFFSALISRCVPILISSNVQDLIEYDDYPEKRFHKIDLAFEKDVVVPFKEYDFIRNVIMDFQVKPSMFFRTLNDCVRSYALLQTHNVELYNYIITARNWNATYTS